MVKKTTVRTGSVKKKVKVIEKEVEVVDDTPKRYYVDFYLKKEPIAKDEKIGTIFYSDTTESLEVEGAVPTYRAGIEKLMLGNIWFMDGVKQIFVSCREDLKNWVLNLHRAENFDRIRNQNIYASEAVINNETE